jgi:hypothetical protein
MSRRLTNGRKRRRTEISGQFAPRLIEMLGSWPYRALSLSARRVLDGLEIELGSHGGTDNGKLPCTYDNFHDYGIDRHAIAPAIREAVALGFVEITEEGTAGNREFRRPNLFRLTYRHTDRADPTDDWRKIETKEQAELAKAARQYVKRHRFTVGENTKSSGGNPHRKRRFHSGKTPTTLDISGGGHAPKQRAKKQQSYKSYIAPEGRSSSSSSNGSATRARQAWEASLCEALRREPAALAAALDQLSKRPDLCDRATAAEARSPGEGVRVISAALAEMQSRPA